VSKIVITLVDEENGHVRLVVDPPIPALVEIAKSNHVTPGEVYAMKAIRVLVEASNALGKEQQGAPLLTLPSHERFNLEVL